MPGVDSTTALLHTLSQASPALFHEALGLPIPPSSSSYPDTSNLPAPFPPSSSSSSTFFPDPFQQNLPSSLPQPWGGDLRPDTVMGYPRSLSGGGGGMPASQPHTSYPLPPSFGPGVGAASNGEGQGQREGVVPTGPMIERTTITISAIGINGEEREDEEDAGGGGGDVYYYRIPQPHHQQSPWSHNVEPFPTGAPSGGFAGPPSYQPYHGYSASSQLASTLAAVNPLLPSPPGSSQQTRQGQGPPPSASSAVPSIGQDMREGPSFFTGGSTGMRMPPGLTAVERANASGPSYDHLQSYEEYQGLPAVNRPTSNSAAPFPPVPSTTTGRTDSHEANRDRGGSGNDPQDRNSGRERGESFGSAVWRRISSFIMTGGGAGGGGEEEEERGEHRLQRQRSSSPSSSGATENDRHSSASSSRRGTPSNHTSRNNEHNREFTSLSTPPLDFFSSLMLVPSISPSLLAFAPPSLGVRPPPRPPANVRPPPPAQMMAPPSDRSQALLPAPMPRNPSFAPGMTGSSGRPSPSLLPFLSPPGGRPVSSSLSAGAQPSSIEVSHTSGMMGERDASTSAAPTAPGGQRAWGYRPIAQFNATLYFDLMPDGTVRPVRVDAPTSSSFSSSSSSSPSIPSSLTGGRTQEPHDVSPSPLPLPPHPSVERRRSQDEFLLDTYREHQSQGYVPINSLEGTSSSSQQGISLTQGPPPSHSHRLFSYHGTPSSLASDINSSHTRSRSSSTHTAAAFAPSTQPTGDPQGRMTVSGGYTAGIGGQDQHLNVIRGHPDQGSWSRFPQDPCRIAPHPTSQSDEAYSYYRREPPQQISHASLSTGLMMGGEERGREGYSHSPIPRPVTFPSGGSRLINGDDPREQAGRLGANDGRDEAIHQPPDLSGTIGSLSSSSSFSNAGTFQDEMSTRLQTTVTGAPLPIPPGRLLVPGSVPTAASSSTGGGGALSAWSSSAERREGETRRRGTSDGLTRDGRIENESLRLGGSRRQSTPSATFDRGQLNGASHRRFPLSLREGDHLPVTGGNYTRNSHGGGSFQARPSVDSSSSLGQTGRAEEKNDVERAESLVSTHNTSSLTASHLAGFKGGGTPAIQQAEEEGGTFTLSADDRRLPICLAYPFADHLDDEDGTSSCSPPLPQNGPSQLSMTGGGDRGKEATAVAPGMRVEPSSSSAPTSHPHPSFYTPSVQGERERRRSESLGEERRPNGTRGLLPPSSLSGAPEAPPHHHPYPRRIPSLSVPPTSVTPPPPSHPLTLSRTSSQRRDQERGPAGEGARGEEEQGEGEMRSDLLLLLQRPQSAPSIISEESILTAATTALQEVLHLGPSRGHSTTRGWAHGPPSTSNTATGSRISLNCSTPPPLSDMNGILPTSSHHPTHSPPPPPHLLPLPHHPPSFVSVVPPQQQQQERFSSLSNGQDHSYEASAPSLLTPSRQGSAPSASPLLPSSPFPPAMHQPAGQGGGGRMVSTGAASYLPSYHPGQPPIHSYITSNGISIDSRPGNPLPSSSPPPPHSSLHTNPSHVLTFMNFPSNAPSLNVSSQNPPPLLPHPPLQRQTSRVPIPPAPLLPPQAALPSPVPQTSLSSRPPGPYVEFSVGGGDGGPAIQWRGITMPTADQVAELLSSVSGEGGGGGQVITVWTAEPRTPPDGGLGIEGEGGGEGRGFATGPTEQQVIIQPLDQLLLPHQQHIETQQGQQAMFATRATADVTFTLNGAGPGATARQDHSQLCSLYQQTFEVYRQRRRQVKREEKERKEKEREEKKRMKREEAKKKKKKREWERWTSFYRSHDDSRGGVEDMKRTFGQDLRIDEEEEDMKNRQNYHNRSSKTHIEKTNESEKDFKKKEEDGGESPTSLRVKTATSHASVSSRDKKEKNRSSSSPHSTREEDNEDDMRWASFSSSPIASSSLYRRQSSGDRFMSGGGVTLANRRRPSAEVSLQDRRRDGEDCFETRSCVVQRVDARSTGREEEEGCHPQQRDLYERFVIERESERRGRSLPINIYEEEEKEKKRGDCGKDSSGGGVSPPFLKSLSRHHRRRREEDISARIKKEEEGREREDDDDANGNTFFSVLRKAAFSKRRGLFREDREDESRERREKKNRKEGETDTTSISKKTDDKDYPNMSIQDHREDSLDSFIRYHTPEESILASSLMEEEEEEEGEQEGPSTLAPSSHTGGVCPPDDNEPHGNRNGGGLLVNLLRKVSSSFLPERLLSPSSHLSGASGQTPPRSTAPSRRPVTREGGDNTRHFSSCDTREKSLMKDEEDTQQHVTVSASWLATGPSSGLLQSEEPQEEGSENRIERLIRRDDHDNDAIHRDNSLLVDRCQHEDRKEEERQQREKQKETQETKGEEGEPFGNGGSTRGEESSQLLRVMRDEEEIEKRFDCQEKESASSCSPPLVKSGEEELGEKREEFSSACLTEYEKRDQDNTRHTSPSPSTREDTKREEEEETLPPHAKTKKEEDTDERFSSKTKNLEETHEVVSSRVDSLSKNLSSSSSSKDSISPKEDPHSSLASSPPSTTNENSSSSSSFVYTPWTLSSYSPATSRLTALSSSSSSSSPTVLGSNSVAGEEECEGGRREEASTARGGGLPSNSHHSNRQEEEIHISGERQSSRPPPSSSLTGASHYPATASSSSSLLHSAVGSSLSSSGDAMRGAGRSNTIRSGYVNRNTSPYDSSSLSSPVPLLSSSFSSSTDMPPPVSESRVSTASMAHRRQGEEGLPARTRHECHYLSSQGSKRDGSSDLLKGAGTGEGLTRKEKAKYRRYLRRMQRRRIMIEKRQIFLLLSTYEVLPCTQSPSPPPLPLCVKEPSTAETFKPASLGVVSSSFSSSSVPPYELSPRDVEKKFEEANAIDGNERRRRSSLSLSQNTSYSTLLSRPEDTSLKPYLHNRKESHRGTVSSSSSFRAKEESLLSSSSSSFSYPNYRGYVNLFELQSEGFFLTSSSSSGSRRSVSSTSLSSHPSRHSDCEESCQGVSSSLNFPSYHRKDYASSSSDSSFMSTSTEDEDDEEMKFKKLQRKANHLEHPIHQRTSLPSSQTTASGGASSFSFSSSSSSSHSSSSSSDPFFRRSGEGPLLPGYCPPSPCLPGPPYTSATSLGGRGSTGGICASGETSSSSSFSSSCLNFFSGRTGSRSRSDEPKEEEEEEEGEKSALKATTKIERRDEVEERKNEDKREEEKRTRGGGKSADSVSRPVRREEGLYPEGESQSLGEIQWTERRRRQSPHAYVQGEDEASEKKNHRREGEKLKMEKRDEANFKKNESPLLPQSESDDTKNGSLNSSRRGSITSEGAVSLRERLLELSSKYHVWDKNTGTRGGFPRNENPSSSFSSSSLPISSSPPPPPGDTASSIASAASPPGDLHPGRNGFTSREESTATQRRSGEDEEEEKTKERESNSKQECQRHVEGERMHERRTLRGQHGEEEEGDRRGEDRSARERKRESFKKKEEEGRDHRFYSWDSQDRDTNCSRYDQRPRLLDDEGRRGSASHPRGEVEEEEEQQGLTREQLASTTSPASLWKGYSSYFQEMRERVLDQLRQNDDEEEEALRTSDAPPNQRGEEETQKNLGKGEEKKREGEERKRGSGGGGEAAVGKTSDIRHLTKNRRRRRLGWFDEEEDSDSCSGDDKKETPRRMINTTDRRRGEEEDDDRKKEKKNGGEEDHDKKNGGIDTERMKIRKKKIDEEGLGQEDLLRGGDRHKLQYAGLDWRHKEEEEVKDAGKEQPVCLGDSARSGASPQAKNTPTSSTIHPSRSQESPRASAFHRIDSSREDLLSSSSGMRSSIKREQGQYPSTSLPLLNNPSPLPSSSCSPPLHPCSPPLVPPPPPPPPPSQQLQQEAVLYRRREAADRQREEEERRRSEESNRSPTSQQRPSPSSPSLPVPSSSTHPHSSSSSSSSFLPFRQPGTSSYPLDSPSVTSLIPIRPQESFASYFQRASNTEAFQAMVEERSRRLFDGVMAALGREERYDDEQEEERRRNRQERRDHENIGEEERLPRQPIEQQEEGASSFSSFSSLPPRPSLLSSSTSTSQQGVYPLSSSSFSSSSASSSSVLPPLISSTRQDGLAVDPREGNSSSSSFSQEQERWLSHLPGMVPLEREQSLHAQASLQRQELQLSVQNRLNDIYFHQHLSQPPLHASPPGGLSPPLFQTPRLPGQRVHEETRQAEEERDRRREEGYQGVSLPRDDRGRAHPNRRPEEERRERRRGREGGGEGEEEEANDAGSISFTFNILPGNEGVAMSVFHHGGEGMVGGGNLSRAPDSNDLVDMMVTTALHALDQATDGSHPHPPSNPVFIATPPSTNPGGGGGAGFITASSSSSSSPPSWIQLFVQGVLREASEKSYVLRIVSFSQHLPELYFLFCGVLSGRFRRVVQERLFKAGMMPLLSQIFDSMPWFAPSPKRSSSSFSSSLSHKKKKKKGRFLSEKRRSLTQRGERCASSSSSSVESPSAWEKDRKKKLRHGRMEDRSLLLSCCSSSDEMEEEEEREKKGDLIGEREKKKKKAKERRGDSEERGKRKKDEKKKKNERGDLLGQTQERRKKEKEKRKKRKRRRKK
ncbi:hypothetical protein CSUI_000923 [Cystoisospora suis]|uniref:Uncharacterized protein n=1 Tax=Cystoisospora suis TaxID=483139 RepID=A0A2C6KMI0_9APIC|nr:hypothetical protein CSUI_000923 [Cystoisospora suis]